MKRLFFYVTLLAAATWLAFAELNPPPGNSSTAVSLGGYVATNHQGNVGIQGSLTVSNSATVGDSITVNGTASIMPNQTASAGASVMTRDLGDARYYRDQGRDEYNRSMATMRRIAASEFGSVTANGGTFQVLNGNLLLGIPGNAPSNAITRARVSSFNTGTGDGVGTRRTPMSWAMISAPSTWGVGNGTMSMWFGLGWANLDFSTGGTLTNTGIGVLVNSNRAVIAQVHNGSTLTIATNGLFLAFSAINRLICNYSSGVFSVFLAGTNAGVTLPQPVLVCSLTNTLPASLPDSNLEIVQYATVTNTSASALQNTIKSVVVTEYQ
jgi:hypothetical protein